MEYPELEGIFFPSISNSWPCIGQSQESPPVPEGIVQTLPELPFSVQSCPFINNLIIIKLMHSEIYLKLCKYQGKKSRNHQAPGALNSQPVHGEAVLPSLSPCHFKPPGMTKLTFFVLK